jgi:hypothetical protein
MLDDLSNQLLTGGTVQQMSTQIGADPATTRQAVTAALPVLLGQLARNASAPGGAEALAGALGRDHDGSVLDDVPSAVSGFRSGAGASILRHVFGQRQPAVQSGLGKVSGLNSQQTQQLLAMLAPIVLGMLGRAKRQRGLDAKGVADVLGNEQQEVSRSPLGGLLGLLDADKDGSVVDDAMGVMGRVLGRR